MEPQIFIVEKPNPVVRIVAIVLLSIGTITLASAVLVMLTHLFLPLAAIGAVVFVSWWGIRKFRGPTSLSMGEEIKDAVCQTLREAVRLIDKTIRAGVAATKAVREESKR